MNNKILTNLRPLPLRKGLRRGGKKTWVPTSFRFEPELHAFLKRYAEAKQVDMSYVVIELLEQLRAFETARKRGKRA